MSVPPPQVPRTDKADRPLDGELSLLARIEDLIGEEHALLLIPAEERGARDHARLREIEDELDRIWEKLRDRAGRLGRGQAGPTTGGGSTSP
jgi:hypothetical protein